MRTTLESINNSVQRRDTVSTANTPIVEKSKKKTKQKTKDNANMGTQKRKGEKWSGETKLQDAKVFHTHTHTHV